MTSRLIVLWNAERGHPRLRARSPELARLAGLFLRGYMWVIPPWLLFQVMRNFVSALERPGWILGDQRARHPAQWRCVSWALIFGHLGLPELGICRRRDRQLDRLDGHGARARPSSSLTDRQFRRFHLFGRFWRPDWPRFRQLFKLGGPIGLTMGFEGARVQRRRLSHGPVRRRHPSPPTRSRCRSPRRPSWSRLRLGQAATVRVGLAYGRQDRARHRASPAGRRSASASASWL